MKFVFQISIFFFLFGTSTLVAQDHKTVETETTPKAVLVNHAAEDIGIQWDTNQFDYGTIPQNVPAEAVFTLTNTSDKPLVITKVKGSCGCTATAHSEEPVLPGASTQITATYNAKKAGAFTKFVKVTTDRSEKPISLKIKGTVEAAK